MRLVADLRRDRLEAVALVVVVAVAAWLSCARWIPISGDPAPSFVLVTATARLGLGWLIATTAVGLGLRRRSDVSLSTLRPLWLVGLLLVPYLRLFAPRIDSLLVIGAFTYECRLVVVLVAIGWCAIRWLRGAPLERAASNPARWLPWGVAGAALAAALVSSPPGRFGSAVGGDEPKYLRFCEVLLQTQGFDLNGLSDFVRFRPSDVHWLGFPRSLSRTIAEEMPQMAHDAAALVRGAAPATFNRASYAQGWFITGKSGGLYQIHLPGYSFLLLPAYATDRLLLSPTDWIERGVPTRLYATSFFVALLFAAWIAALYRFLRDATRSPWTAAAVALATGLTIPVLPFHFQYYPEAAAGLVLLVLVRHLELGPRAGAVRAAWLGLLTGYLAWLHNRFAPVSLLLAIWFVARHRRALRPLVAFGSAYGACLALQALYYYRITGSVLPTSMWAVIPGRAPIELARIPRALAGVLFDRRFGVLPLAPIYALAPAGWWLAARAHRGRVLRLTAPVVVVVGLSAAHFDWWGGGSSPARLVAAIVPFAAMGFVEIVRLARRDRVIATLGITLLAISVENAFTYTRHFTRLEPVLRGDTGFGYRTALGFPSFAIPMVGQEDARPITAYWLAIVAGVTALVLVRAARRAKSTETSGPMETLPTETLPMEMLPAALLVLAGVAAVYTVPFSLLGMPRVDASLLPSGPEVRLRTLDALVRHPYGWVFSSERGRESPARLKQTALVATYTVGGSDAIEPLQGETIPDATVPPPPAPGALPGRGVLHVPPSVPRGRRFARVWLDGAVGGPQALEVHARRGETLAASPAEPAFEIRVVDNVFNLDIARRVVRAADDRRYRSFDLGFEIPQGAGPVVRLTKMGSTELFVDRVRLEHR